MKLFLAILLLSVCCAAKDKSPVKPVLTAEQKIILLTAERDYLAAQKAAAPYDFAVQQSFSTLQSKQLLVLKDAAIDSTKWALDLMTFEFTPIETPKAAEEKPDKK